MGDRTWTGITFSGKCNSEVAEELVQELLGQGCQAQAGPEGELTVEHLREAHNQFYDDQCNYASMDGVEAFCQDKGISFLKVWEAGGDYEGGFHLYNAVVNQSFEVNGADEPALNVSELEKFAKQGKTRHEVIAYLKAIADFDKKYPALEIVE